MSRRKTITKAAIYLIIIAFFFGLYLSGLHRNAKEDLSSALHEDELLIDYTIEDPFAYTLINRNGINEYGDLFAVFMRGDDAWNRIYENDFKNLMPWKVELGDIDGDDNKEVLIALRKKTIYDKVIKNRMFIFNYKDNILFRKWTGSRIAGIWREFYAMDLLSAPGDELVFIEQTGEDSEKISVYSWFDFGFFMVAESDTYPGIKTVNMKDKNLLEIIYTNNEEEIRQVLTVLNGKLVADEDD